MTTRADSISLNIVHDFDGRPADVVRSDPPLSIRAVTTNVSHTGSFETTISFDVTLADETNNHRWTQTWETLDRMDRSSRSIVIDDLLGACEALRSAGYDIDTSDVEDE